MNHAKYREGERRTDPLPSPTVYRLASERRYHEIPTRVKACPQDIYWEDRYGSTALHILCCSPQLGDALIRAIEVIIERDPSLIAQPNQTSWTPLHLVCEKRLLWRTTVATGDLVVKLVQACPGAVSIPMQTGKTPFHIACETNASLSVLEAMLRVDASLVALQTYSKTGGETPLEMVWQAGTNDPQSSLGNSLPKMELLLRGAYCGTVVPEENNSGTKPFSLLCAVSSIRCPRDYVSRIVSLFPEQVSVPDRCSGFLPLHYAILTAQEEDTTAYTSFLIERLLEEYPEAAMVPFRRGGRLLPLHVLIGDRAMTWHNGGVQPLVLASYEVLVMPDPRTRLVPALQSAEHAFKSRQHLSTTYELLRLAPQVLQEDFFQIT
jgi:hypothetical protein